MPISSGASVSHRHLADSTGLSPTSLNHRSSPASPSAASASAPVSSSLTQQLPPEIRSMLHWINSLPIDACAVVEDLEQLLPVSDSTYHNQSNSHTSRIIRESLLRDISLHVLHQLHPSLRSPTSTLDFLDCLQYLLARVHTSSTQAPQQQQQQPPPPPEEDLPAFAHEIEEGNMVLLWRLLKWLRFISEIHNTSSSSSELQQEQPETTTVHEPKQQSLPQTEPRRPSSTKPAVSESKPLPQKTRYDLLLEEQERQQRRSRSRSRKKQQPTLQQPKMSFAFKSKKQLLQQNSGFEEEKENVSPEQQAAIGPFVSKNESLLCHTDIHSTTQQSKLHQAGIESIPTEEIVAARMHGRIQAMRESNRLLQGQRSRTRSQSADRRNTASPSKVQPYPENNSYAYPQSTYKNDVSDLKQISAELHAHSMTSQTAPSSNAASVSAAITATESKRGTQRSPSPRQQTGRSRSTSRSRRGVSISQEEVVSNQNTQIRRQIHNEAAARLAARSASQTKSTPIAPTYPIPSTILPLPHIPPTATPQKVFTWLRDVLHVDLLSDASDVDQSSLSSSSEQPIPPPTTESQFWSHVCSLCRDGVVAAQIASALSGEDLHGIELHPRGAAAARFNWQTALEALVVSSHAEAVQSGRVMSYNARTKDQAVPGSGLILFSAVFTPADLHQAHPATIWAFLASVFHYYATSLKHSRGWSVERAPGTSATASNHSTASAAGSAEESNPTLARDVLIRAFVGSTSLRPEPATFSNSHREHSESPTNEEESAGVARTARKAAVSSTPGSATRPKSASAGLGNRATPQRSTAKTPSAATPVTNPSSFPSSFARNSSRRVMSSPRPASARKSGPSKVEAEALAAAAAAASYASLQSLADAVEQSHNAFDRSTRSHLPQVFQPKNSARTLWDNSKASSNSRPVRETMNSARLAGQARPDQPGVYYGPAQAVTVDTNGEIVSTGSTILTSPSSLMDWSVWPPIYRVDAVQEKVVRAWLSDELGIQVPLSVEHESTSPLTDPYRNGLVLLKVCAAFKKKIVSALDPGEEGKICLPPAVQARMRPTMLVHALENTIRSLLSLKTSLQSVQEYRNTMKALEEDDQSFPPEHKSLEAYGLCAQDFEFLLHALDEHLEKLIDSLVQGDGDALWGFLFYLMQEWTVLGQMKQSSNTPHPAAASTSVASEQPVGVHNSAWSPIEIALLQWIQEIGVGVSMGVVDEDQADVVLSSRVATTPSLTSSPVSYRSSRQLNKAAPSVLPTWPQIGVHQFCQLFRKGVLLCDLVCATATPLGSTIPFATQQATVIKNIVRDPRTWSLCRANLSKALDVLRSRPRMSLHLLRVKFDKTLEELALGNREVIMNLLWDIYACHAGEAPHASDKDCMGRAKQSREFIERQEKLARENQFKKVQEEQKVLQQERDELLANPPLPQPQASPQRSPRSANQHSLKVNSVSSSKNGAATAVAGASLQQSQAQKASAAVPSKPITPKLVTEAHALFDWLHSRGLKSLAERLQSPKQLISPAEFRSLPSQHQHSLHVTSGRPHVADEKQEEAATEAFSDGIILCELVAKLLHQPIKGVVHTPTQQQLRSQASMRAIRLHNVELALNALRQNQRMALTYLYREGANAVVANRFAYHSSPAAGYPLGLPCKHSQTDIDAIAASVREVKV